jgi:glutathione S-transferase
MIRLFHAPLSPFCRKVRLTLAEKKLEVELVEERFWEQAPEFMRRNPAGKVPVLRMGAMTLSESQAICEYIEETVPTPPLMPRDAAARFEVRRICAWFDDKFYTEVSGKVLHEKVTKKLAGQGQPDSRAVKSAAAALKYHMEYLGWLLDHRRWIAGDVMTLADFTAAAHLSSLDFMGNMEWDRSPTVKEWYTTLKSRPAFRTLLADHLLGFQPPSSYADLDF